MRIVKKSLYRIIAWILTAASAVLLGGMVSVIGTDIYDRQAYGTGHVFYSIQQESNPFDSSVADYQSFESKLKNIGQYYEVYGQYLEPYYNNGQKFYDDQNDSMKKNPDAIRSLQLNQDAANYFHLKTKSGRTFRTDDFTYNGSEVPVILGSAYDGIYKVGDTFQLEYLFTPLNFKVIGILKPMDAATVGGLKYFDFDNSVILPMFDVNSADVSHFDDHGIRIHYANRISGFFDFPKTTADTNIASLKKLLATSACGTMSYGVSPESDFVLDQTGRPLAFWYGIGAAALAGMLALYAFLLHRVKNVPAHPARRFLTDLAASGILACGGFLLVVQKLDFIPDRVVILTWVVFMTIVGAVIMYRKTKLQNRKAVADLQ